MLLSIILVNYNSGEMLSGCIQSIRESGIGFAYEIIVVDNASVDDSLKQAQATYADVRYIINNENAGFAKANNQGIDIARGKYILIQNPDTLVVGNAIETLVSFIRNNPDIGITSGILLNEDHTLQHSIRRFPSVTGQLFEALFIHKLTPRLSRKFGEVVLDEMVYKKPLDVDWVTGAVMLLSRDVISKVGKLDESFFLYAEEVDWCYRMKKNGLRMVYFPQAVFIHFMGKTNVNLQRYTQHVMARRQFAYKHFSTARARMFDMASLIFLINRGLLFLMLSAVRPSSERRKLRRLYFEASKALLVMMMKAPGVFESPLQRSST